MNQDLIEWLGVRHNALTAIYPPGGYISWHNNANASAYNLIFTWSESANGQFNYVDPSTKEVVVMRDVEGWQCKSKKLLRSLRRTRTSILSLSKD